MLLLFMLLRKFAAEIIATYALVFCGTGAIVINTVNGANPIGHLGVCLTFGAVVTVLIYAFGELSGTHINPAVSFGFWLSGRMPANEMVVYWAAQIIGAIGASYTLVALFPGLADYGSTVPAGSDMQSFILEVIISFMLMLIILHIATGSKEQGLMAGLAIGTMVGLEALFAGPISGASMNPARSIGPALASGQMGVMWIYIAGPMLGMALSVPVWKFLTSKTNYEAV